MESRRVSETSIQPLTKLRKEERSRFLNPLVRPSVVAAATQNSSLALIRPFESRFSWSRRTTREVETERRAYEKAARQKSLFDKELAEIVPCPFNFRLRFRDESGWHDHQCEDWETEAAFSKLSKSYEEAEVLRHFDAEYNQRRPTTGLLLVMGNMAARPQTWLLLAILAVPEPEPDLFAISPMAS